MLKNTSFIKVLSRGVVYPLLFPRVFFEFSSNVNVDEYNEIEKPEQKGIFYGGKMKLLNLENELKRAESENSQSQKVIKSEMSKLMEFSKTAKQVEELILKNPRDIKSIKAIIEKLLLDKQYMISPALYMKLFTLLWKLKSDEPALLFIEGSKEVATRFLSLYSEKEVLFMIWALVKAKSQDQNREFLKVLKEHFCSLKHSNENYLNLLRMVADMKFYDPETSLEIYKGVRNEIVGFVSSGAKPGEIARLSRFLMEMGEEEKVLWEQILKTLNDKIGELAPTEISEYFWVLSHLKGSEDDPERIIPAEQVF